MTQQIPERLSGGAVDLSRLVGAQTAAGQSASAQTSGSPNAGAPGSAQTVELPSLVFDVTEQSFEQAVQLSGVVPVVIDLWATWCGPCKTLGPLLEKITVEFAGRLVLGKVDVDANPGLAQAFQAQSIPTVVALIAGRAVPMFQGAIPEQQLREVLTQLVQLGEQQGLTGRVHTPDDAAQPDEPAAPTVNAAHAPALEAIERGDYAAAVQAYEQVLAKSPADREARAALVQTRLLARLHGANAEKLRQAAAAHPNDVTAALRVADLDVSGGHVDDAFARLLELFTTVDDEADRTRVRQRLIELFEVVGVSDTRVIAARGQLANLLY